MGGVGPCLNLFFDIFYGPIFAGVAAVDERVYSTGTAREYQDSMTNIHKFIFSRVSKVSELPCVHRDEHRDEEPVSIATPCRVIWPSYKPGRGRCPSPARPRRMKWREGISASRHRRASGVCRMSTPAEPVQASLLGSSDGPGGHNEPVCVGARQQGEPAYRSCR